MDKNLVCSFVISEKMPTFNEMINLTKQHWSKYATVKKRWTTKVQWIIKALKPKIPKQTEGHFRIEIDWHVKRETADLDNAAFSCKYILDAMEKEGLLPNDNLKHVKEILNRGFQDKKKAWVEVRLYRLTELT